MAMRIRRVGLAGLLCYTALLYYGTLTPFNFSVDVREHAGIYYKEPEWLPFTRVCPVHGYVDIHLKDIAINVVIFIPFGVMLGLCLPATMPARRRLRWVAGSSFAISLTIEIAQYFLPPRLSQLSDLLMNTAGGIVGVWLLVWAWRHYPVLNPAGPPSKRRHNLLQVGANRQNSV